LKFLDFVKPRVGSDEYMSLLVLSPNILSPRVFSEEHMIVEVFLFGLTIRCYKN
jgi:hypothetical protein